jgi:hypothetical protein
MMEAKKKLTIHPVPKRLWNRMKMLQDHGLTGELIIQFSEGKVTQWDLSLTEKHDGEMDVALEAST